LIGRISRVRVFGDSLEAKVTPSTGKLTIHSQFSTRGSSLATNSSMVNVETASSAKRGRLASPNGSFPLCGFLGGIKMSLTTCITPSLTMMSGTATVTKPLTLMITTRVKRDISMLRWWLSRRVGRSIYDHNHEKPTAYRKRGYYLHEWTYGPSLNPWVHCRHPSTACG